MNVQKFIFCTAAVMLLAGCSDGISDMVGPSADDAGDLFDYTDPRTPLRWRIMTGAIPSTSISVSRAAAILLINTNL
ncbi:MAG: hypothetical protein ACI4KF_03730 [Huintestinicola sp.]